MSQANPLVEASKIGQSIWIDYIQRSMLESGDLTHLINTDHITGLTSNPSIFEAAIAKTNEYDASISALIAKDSSISDLDVFNHLAIADIQAAADEFSGVYEATDGQDGMVSLEVPPGLAHDAEGTVKTGIDLHHRVNRPNLMIKVPGTKAGVAAFEQLTTQGINVNVTLLFSISRYREIAQAYISALQARSNASQDISRIASVASFFVSRVDTAVDQALETQNNPVNEELAGKTGIANAKVAYGYFANLFGSEQWRNLEHSGAHAQRLLWASTGVKNPALKDTFYMEELLGPQTVNTVPPATLDAFRKHGVAANRLATHLDLAHKQLSSLQDRGISLSAITDKLEVDGLQSFSESFERLLTSISEKRMNLSA